MLGFYEEHDQEDVANVNEVLLEPATNSQACKSQEADQWRAAMDEEFNSLIKNKTWTLVDLPNDRKPISCKWVYKIKYKQNKVDRFKARLVARGFTQRYGLDYTETFSPVVRMDTVRILLTLANQFKWRMTQIDVKTAFLYGSIKEEIYMNQPEGYSKSSQVCKLNRSLYGLKQASLEWNRCFSKFLKTSNLKPLLSDSCVFVNSGCNITKANRPLLILCIYVDDGLIMSNQRSTIKACVDHPKTKFEITTAKPDTFVGIEITRDEDHLFMNQSSFIKSLINKFNLQDAMPSTLPFASCVKVC